jgi:hypothetical protein
LLPAALDTLAVGLWALARPADLFALLQAPPLPDPLLLWQALGALSLGHVLCLGAAIVRPDPCSGLVLVPLLGRALQAGIWLWLLGSDRVQGLPRHPLTLLLIHDTFWLAVFALYLGVWVLARNQRPPDAGTDQGESEASRC